MKTNNSLVFSYNGAAISYQIQGRGAAVVLLHGYCEDSFIWKEGIKKWAKTNTCIALDLPGFGQSSLLQKPYKIIDLADMIAMLLDFLRIPKAIIIGHSMGGYVALSFAKQYPSKLCGLGLVHSHCFLDSPEKITNRKKSIQFIEKHGAAPFLKSFYPNLFAPDSFNQHKYIIDTLTRRNRNLSNRAIIEGGLALIGREDQQQTLSDCKVPVFIFSGGKDNAVPVALSLKMASLPAFCDFHFVEHIGHMGFYEYKVQFEKVVGAFLAISSESPYG